MSSARDEYKKLKENPVKELFPGSESGPFDFFKSIFGVPTEADKREQNSLIKEQVDAYKAATELTRKQLEETKKEKDLEKRKINEKQIRQLRGNYRSAGGFLNSQGTSGLQSTSTTGLPNKLGA